jgi:hypothetical protein
MQERVVTYVAAVVLFVCLEAARLAGGAVAVGAVVRYGIHIALDMSLLFFQVQADRGEEFRPRQPVG